jgi:putative membrane protein
VVDPVRKRREQSLRRQGAATSTLESIMPTRLSVAVLCLFFAACSQLGLGGREGASSGQSAPPSNRQDVKFMENIAQANLAEIATGKLAVAKAQSPLVKQFGQQMIDDHTKMLNEGASLASAKGMPVPKSPEFKHQAAAKKLEAMSGGSFDRAYMQQMVADHNDTLELLKQASTQAGDPALRAHAEKAIPHVQQHLEVARRLTGELVGSAR